MDKTSESVPWSDEVDRHMVEEFKAGRMSEDELDAILQADPLFRAAEDKWLAEWGMRRKQS